MTDWSAGREPASASASSSSTTPRSTLSSSASRTSASARSESIPASASSSSAIVRRGSTPRRRDAHELPRAHGAAARRAQWCAEPERLLCELGCCGAGATIAGKRRGRLELRCHLGVRLVDREGQVPCADQWVVRDLGDALVNLAARLAEARVED